MIVVVGSVEGLFVVLLVVALVELEPDTTCGEDSEADKVGVEGPWEFELSKLNLLHKSVLADEAACKHGDTTDQGVGADDSSELSNDGSFELVGKVTTCSASKEPEGPDEPDVGKEVGEYESVDKDSTEEAANSSNSVDCDLVGLGSEPASSTRSCKADNEGHDAEQNVSGLSSSGLLEYVESTEGVHH